MKTIGVTKLKRISDGRMSMVRNIRYFISSTIYIPKSVGSALGFEWEAIRDTGFYNFFFYIQNFLRS